MTNAHAITSPLPEENRGMIAQQLIALNQKIDLDRLLLQKNEGKSFPERLAVQSRLAHHEADREALLKQISSQALPHQNDTGYQRLAEDVANARKTDAIAARAGADKMINRDESYGGLE